MVLIDVENAFKEYGVGDSKVQAIRGINLQIAEGEFVAITR